jgi:hypothetical protein
MVRTLEIHIKPNAPRTEIMAKTDKFWHIALTAKPIDGAANQELIKVLEKELSAKVEIIRGKTSKKKLITIDT